ncbi:MAG: PKD domain-containing protein, partial [Thermoplasmata archaeon]
LSDYADVIVTAPVLTMSKSADVSTADPGDYILFTVSYFNSGTGSATGVYVNDTIPEHTTFVSSNPSHDYSSGREYTWFIGSVAPSSGGSIEILVQVVPGTADQTLLHNVATLDYADANGNYYSQLSDYADVIVTAPVMLIDKMGPSTATPCEPISYTITYTNSGSGTATLVEIVDVLPDYVTFIGATPAPTSISGNTLTWTIGMVASGGSGSILIDVKIDLVVPDGEELLNVATLNYADANGNMLPPESDHVITTIEAGSIGDLVWNDENMNGVHEPTEVGVGGITVNLEGITPWGDIITSTTTTDSNGDYLVAGLPPGNYTVSIELPWGWGPTTPNPLSVSLGRGEDFLDADFGIAKAEIEKTVTPDVAKIGDILHVFLWVKNPFPVATVVDTLPPELEYVGNAVDDDGDGLIDEEKKDGLDNDGDGLVDEDLGNFLFDDNYITGGLSLDGNKVIFSLPGRGVFTIEFDIVVVVDPEGEIVVTNLAEIVVDNETVAWDTYDILIRYSGFDKYFLPIDDPQPPPEPGEIVVDGGTPGYFFDYGDGDGIIEVGELIFWLVEYNITNNLNYTWTNTRMEDRWGAEYGVGGDGADNDNDGLIDEEQFNMLDDDGDGKIDEDIDVYYISQGNATITLRGTPPNSDKVYIYWYVGTLAPGETAIMRLPVFTDRNPGDNPKFPEGHQEFTSPGNYTMNSGGVVKWLDDRFKQHSAHTLRLYVNATDDGGNTSAGVYADPVEIHEYHPEDNPTIYEDETQAFWVDISNPSGLKITALWFVDGVQTSEGFSFVFGPGAVGLHPVRVIIAGRFHLVGGSLVAAVPAEHIWNVEVVAYPNSAPVAVVSLPADGSTFLENEEITFDARASFDMESSIEWLWDFGGGLTSTLPVTTHAYETAGIYPVALTVTDMKGLTGSTSVVVQIVEKKPTAIVDAPSRTVFHEGEAIFFSAHALYPGSQSSLTFEWDFGDSSVSTGRDVFHTYSDDGSYTVKLTVSDEAGNKDTVEMDMLILNVDPIAEMEAIHIGDVDEEMSFSAVASDPGDDVLTFEWDFGDGHNAFGVEVVHSYADPGQYGFALTVRDEDGGATTLWGLVVIRGVPEPPRGDETETDDPSETEETPDTGERTRKPDIVVWRRPPSSHLNVEIFSFGSETTVETDKEVEAASPSANIGIILLIAQVILMVLGALVVYRARRRL